MLRLSSGRVASLRIVCFRLLKLFTDVFCDTTECRWFPGDDEGLSLQQTPAPSENGVSVYLVFIQSLLLVCFDLFVHAGSY